MSDFFFLLLKPGKCSFKSSMLDLTIAGFELDCLNKKTTKTGSLQFFCVVVFTFI